MIDANVFTASVCLERKNADGLPFRLDASLSVAEGITILFGPSGSGKSTLLDCLAGLLRPDSGAIHLGGRAFFDESRGIHLPPRQRRVGYLFQSPALFPHLTVEQNVGYGIGHQSPTERETRVRSMLERFRIAALAKRKPREISGGEKQRVALARSLVTQPRALFLDEPLTGLESGLKAAILADLRDWNDEQRIPILYVTHNREEVDALGQHVIVMENGRTSTVGEPQAVLDAPRRHRLAQAAGFENLLEGVVKDLREADGVMRVQLGASTSEIEVPLGYAAPGDSVRVAIRAGDILLATERPGKLSARNILQGTLKNIEQRGTTVVCRAEAGVPFTVHVTPGALRSLELAVNQRVWLVIKTHSCHVVD